MIVANVSRIQTIFVFRNRYNGINFAIKIIIEYFISINTSVLCKNNTITVIIFSIIPKYKGTSGFGMLSPRPRFIKNAEYRINHAKIQYEKRKSTGMYDFSVKFIKLFIHCVATNSQRNEKHPINDHHNHIVPNSDCIQEHSHCSISSTASILSSNTQ